MIEIRCTAYRREQNFTNCRNTFRMIAITGRLITNNVARYGKGGGERLAVNDSMKGNEE